jgi:hypothetical protein
MEPMSGPPFSGCKTNYFHIAFHATRMWVSVGLGAVREGEGVGEGEWGWGWEGWMGECGVGGGEGWGRGGGVWCGGRGGVGGGEGGGVGMIMLLKLFPGVFPLYPYKTGYLHKMPQLVITTVLLCNYCMPKIVTV